jgi:hypothetical protein
LAVLQETTDPAVNPWKVETDPYIDRDIDRAEVQRAEWHRQKRLGREPDANERDTIGRDWHSRLVSESIADSDGCGACNVS